MDEIFLALSDGHRRRIIDRLRTGPATVTELAELLPIARPGVSRHLRVLRAAGLVTAVQDGQFRIYDLDETPLRALDEWLQSYRQQWMQRLDALHTEVARGRRNAARTPEIATEEAS